MREFWARLLSFAASVYHFNTISNIVHKLARWLKSAPVVPVVSVTGLLIATILLVQPVFPALFPATKDFPSGPYLALEGGAIASAAGPTDNIQLISTGPTESVLGDGSILASATPVSGLSLTPDGLILYKVQKGDTVGNLATKFNISANTILWANHLSKGARPVVGQELIILPVSGVLYDVQAGDTLASISSAYNVTPSDIVQLINNGGQIQEGDLVVIQNAKPPKTSSNSQNLPNLGNYLKSPVKNGLSTGVLDSNNAVTISSFCGAPIFASADGLVTEATTSNSLGGFIKISHPLDGVQTVYAHIASNEVSVGDFVSQGDEIAKAGNTGDMRGAVGCSVYFEVIGAVNPLAK